MAGSYVLTEEEKRLFSLLEKKVRDVLSSEKGCHDLAHTKRVIANTERLLLTEDCAHPFIAITGALLHDVGRPEETLSGGKVCHAETGSKKAMELLRAEGCSEEFVKAVGNVVLRHRFRGMNKPETAEEKIVFDADKLDSLGAYGIGRAFHFSGRIGSSLHNSEAEALASNSYSDGDSAYREYLVKLRRLPEKMFTETGRRLGRERAKFMEEFFARMNSEYSPEKQ